MSIQQFEIWLLGGEMWRMVEITWAMSLEQATKEARIKYEAFGYDSEDIKVTQV